MIAGSSELDQNDSQGASEITSSSDPVEEDVTAPHISVLAPNERAAGQPSVAHAGTSLPGNLEALTSAISCPKTADVASGTAVQDTIFLEVPSPDKDAPVTRALETAISPTQTKAVVPRRTEFAGATASTSPETNSAEPVATNATSIAENVGVADAVTAGEAIGSTTAEAIWEPAELDVLSGRGAFVNSHTGNKRFRAMCFARKHHFDAGNHAAKRRIATETVDITLANGGRFLKKEKGEKLGWFEMTREAAILKACQVMRDYKRPDRLAMRAKVAYEGRNKTRTQESTPMDDVTVPPMPVEPILENPFGVHAHDVLSGRGAAVNGHVGNQRLRELALQRKAQFNAGNYPEKRALATEIVNQIRSLNPPGRFLKRVPRPAAARTDMRANLDSCWEELNDEKAIQKACQVMRDIDRPDRKYRDQRRFDKQKEAAEKHRQIQSWLSHEQIVRVLGGAEEKAEDCKPGLLQASKEENDLDTMQVAHSHGEVEVSAAEQVVAAALDKALDSASDTQVESPCV